jgi:hypothetical protein
MIADLFRAGRGVEQGDAAHVRQVPDLREHLLDLGPDGGVGDVTGLRLEDDGLGVTRQ